MKYGFIHEHKKSYPVQVLCEVLGVSRSGYYDWLERRPGKRELSNQKLDEKIQMTFKQGCSAHMS